MVVSNHQSKKTCNNYSLKFALHRLRDDRKMIFIVIINIPCKITEYALKNLRTGSLLNFCSPSVAAFSI